ncbi:MAG: bifunctional metallophosphatase/5'-nucleotidase [Bacteroidota bacterium]
MKKIIINSALVLLLAVVFSACSNQSKDQSNLKIAILHTNDMHAKIDNMAKLAAYKQEVKDQYDHVFLVSAGDMFSGNPVVDVYEKKGYPMVDLMNRLGYDLTAIGNHEFDYGQEVLAKRMKQADFQFISANINTQKTNLPQPKPYAVLEANGKKLLFVSFIETWNDGLPSTHPSKLKNLEFQEPVESASQFTKLAKEHDAFIGLTHLGYRADKRLAKEYPEFDLIIGGHSHTFLDSAEKVNNTFIAQVGDDINYVGKTVLSFNNDELTDIHTEAIDLKNYEKENKKIASIIKKYNNNEALNEVIGVAKNPIRGKEELGALFTDAQIEIQNLDFAFQNNGGIRIGEIPEGEIKAKTIYQLDPFGNDLVKIEMKPDEIKSLLRSGYQRGNEPNLQIGGGSYTIHLNNENELKRITIRNEDGEKLHADSTYEIGLNSYITETYTFDHEDKGESLYVTTAKNIIDFIKEKKNIDYSGVKRIHVEKTE